MALHPEIAHFYEPYYVWDYYVGAKDSDVRTPADLTAAARQFVRRNFQEFARRTGKPVTIEKTPENSFRVSCLSAVFPSAKWVHIMRDGRDVTLSINKEWQRREQTVLKRDYKYFLFVLQRVFRLQPYWQFRALQILYELKSSRSMNPNFYLNKSKWKGKPGWGPRFPAWEKAHKEYSLIAFNALQWLETLDAAQQGLAKIDTESVFTIRYERFIKDPKAVLQTLTRFLECSDTNEYLGSIPRIDPSNYSKWKAELSEQEIGEIGPLLSSKLIELGYENNERWYKY